MKTILIVDDSRTVRKLIGNALKDSAYKLDEACDGVEALEMSRITKYDLVITDHHMPNMLGIELVGELRAIKAYASVPIIIISTESDPKLRKMSKEKGATGWIQKPINLQTLDKIVQKVLNLDVAVKYSHEFES